MCSLTHPQNQMHSQTGHQNKTHSQHVTILNVKIQTHSLMSFCPSPSPSAVMVPISVLSTELSVLPVLRSSHSMLFMNITKLNNAVLLTSP
jgi:hypothetical protein